MTSSLQAAHKKKSKQWALLCHLVELSPKSIIHQTQTEEKQPPKQPSVVLFATASFCYRVGTGALQMFGPDELSVIWPGGRARGRWTSWEFPEKGQANKRSKWGIRSGRMWSNRPLTYASLIIAPQRLTLQECRAANTCADPSRPLGR